ncbi:BatD family protein [Motilimonas pumila]|uniref:Protein BatD n=1 Tax=Motilimonas pumila TaxID=2303987 RepID=A0A418YGB2_9GAMM|nr:BatD family protein [Motilimonas pumila]RJG48674.1 protein BatD [Motilimonas pumila]
MSRLWFYLTLILMWAPHSAFAAISASISQNPVYQGEIFTLEIEVDESADPDALDTRPLEQNFDVFRPSVSRQKSMINGKFTSVTRWRVSLSAKTEGMTQIPALNVAGQLTRPIAVKVVSQGEQADEPKDVFITAELDKTSVYPGQQVIYTVQVYTAVNLENANLNAPKLTGADISQIGQDQKEIAIKDGLKYHKITRRFAINPSQSGQFDIAPAQLTGDGYKRVNNQGYNRMIRSNINEASQALTLEVKAKPAGFAGQWLVSPQVMLNAELQNKAQSLVVGQPVTRTFTLIAADTPQAALPEFNFQYPDGVRIYPDKDELSQFTHQGQAYAQRISSHAIIAEQAGELVLPEVKIPWWNSATDKIEYAIVPAQTVTVIAAAQEPEQAIIESHGPTTIVERDAGFWPWLSALLGLGWLVTLIFYFNRPRLAVATTPRTATANNLPKQKLLAACEQNDKSQAWQAWLVFKQDQWPHDRSPLGIHHELAQALKQLEAAIAQNAPWQGDELARSINTVSKTATESETIAPLNPS